MLSAITTFIPYHNHYMYKSYNPRALKKNKVLELPRKYIIKIKYT